MDRVRDRFCRRLVHRIDTNKGCLYSKTRVGLSGKKTIKEVEKMENNQDKWVCAHCGYTASGKFVGDICPQCGLTFWKCSKCGFLVTVATPPDVCPECGEKCAFVNVTCYTPECGGPGHFDPRLV